jgi:hypothetical protein
LILLVLALFSFPVQQERVKKDSVDPLPFTMENVQSAIRDAKHVLATATSMLKELAKKKP